MEFFSGPFFPVFGLNTGKYGPEKNSVLDTFHGSLINIVFIDISNNMEL